MVIKSIVFQEVMESALLTEQNGALSGRGSGVTWPICSVGAHCRKRHGGAMRHTPLPGKGPGDGLTEGAHPGTKKSLNH